MWSTSHALMHRIRWRVNGVCSVQPYSMQAISSQVVEVKTEDLAGTTAHFVSHTNVGVDAGDASYKSTKSYCLVGRTGTDGIPALLIGCKATWYPEEIGGDPCNPVTL